MNVVKKIFQILSSDILLTVAFYNPTRQDVLLEKVNKRLSKTHQSGNYAKIIECVKALSNKDFVILSNPNDEEQFIQCTLDEKGILVDYPYSVIDQRSRLTHRLDYVLFKQGFICKTPLFPSDLSDHKKGSFRHEMNRYGCGYTIYCGTDFQMAAKLMHQILIEVYGLDPEFEMEIKIETWKKFWV